MDFSTHFQSLAHAYLIQGNKKNVEGELVTILLKLHNISSQGNSDFWSKQFTTFSIEDARQLKEQALRKKTGAGKRVFIINADALTREASNALLKTLEEPAEDTHFFLILPSLKRVLPTILSRTQSVTHSSERESVLISIDTFIKLSVSERMKEVKDILVQLEKEKISKSDIAFFIEDLIRYQYKKGKSDSKQAEIASYAPDQSASVKMILEYLALSI